MPNLIMLVGNIGSGKSTFVKELTKRGYIVVSRDALRIMVGGGKYVFDVDLEPEIFRIERYALRVLSDFGHNIVIDETNMSLTIRGRHLDCIKDKGYRKIAIIMPKLSKEESITRRLEDNHGDNGRQVWGDVWDRFDKIYTAPTKEEGFDIVTHYEEDELWDYITDNLF